MSTRSRASSSASAVETAVASPITVVASGLPDATTMGALESLILPLCSGRIVAIGLQAEGTAVIEFALHSDADSVVGEHELLGTPVQFVRPGVEPPPPPPPPPPLPPPPAVSGKRTRSSGGSCGGGAASAEAPMPAPAVPVTSVVMLDDGMPKIEESTEPIVPAASVSTGFDSLTGSPNGGYDGSALVAAAVPPALDAAASMASLAALADADSDGGGGAPVPKKHRAETKKEKERRMNRVGLSYRCGRCGLPKKGHVCVGTVDGMPLDGSGLGMPMKISPASDGSEAGGSSTTPPGGRWDLDSESIFKDIKSVLQAPPPPAAGGAGGKANGKAGGGSKRRASKSKGDMPPPMPPHIVPAVVAERAAEKTQLLEELDIAMQRPPSVITPDDGDHSRSAGGPSSLGAPSSLVSASDMFSPGQLMTHLLGTPTPAITPGLSPGTLNELGNMLQSPGAALASAQKAAAAAAAVEAASLAATTPIGATTLISGLGSAGFGSGLGSAGKVTATVISPGAVAAAMAAETVTPISGGQ